MPILQLVGAALEADLVLARNATNPSALFAECWKSSCSPNLLAASSAASYGLEAQVERQAHAPSHTAFLWREPHVLPWSASAAAAAEAEAHSQALRSGAGSRAAVTPGSNDFAVVEVGGGGGASVGAARLGQPEPPRGTFVGLLSVSLLASASHGQEVIA